jgi:hypothetical protein
MSRWNVPPDVLEQTKKAAARVAQSAPRASERRSAARLLRTLEREEEPSPEPDIVRLLLAALQNRINQLERKAK